jgi:hypothetical protein
MSRTSAANYWFSDSRTPRSLGRSEEPPKFDTGFPPTADEYEVVIVDR